MSSELVLREYGRDGDAQATADREQAWALGVLAFGGDPHAVSPPARPGRRSLGVFDGPRLVAKASVLAYEQWWGGRRVPMAGVAGVAVHPDVRGTGVAKRLLAGLEPLMTGQGQVVSALFPTAIGLYRQLGWELVGSLDETVLRTADLRAVRPAVGVSVRTAAAEDLPQLWRLWQDHAAAGNGLLSRDGPMFPHGAAGVLEAEVVSLGVVQAPGGGDRVVGYVSYDRGRGYGPGAGLRVHELVAATGAAAATLVRSLASWDSVVDDVVWRGPVDQLALLLGRSVAPVARNRPWMLRLVDVAGAVAARGYRAGPALELDLELVGPGSGGVGRDPEPAQAAAAGESADVGVPNRGVAWRLSVADGVGRLQRVPYRPGLPALHTRGLALLWSASATCALLRRTGLLDGELPGLDAAFAGPAPCLLDYF